jgi:hypothetical protein
LPKKAFFCPNWEDETHVGLKPGGFYIGFITVVDSGQAELHTHSIDIVHLKLQPPYIDEVASVCNLFMASCPTPGNNQLIVIIVPATLFLEFYVGRLWDMHLSILKFDLHGIYSLGWIKVPEMKGEPVLVFNIQVCGTRGQPYTCVHVLLSVHVGPEWTHPIEWCWVHQLMIIKLHSFAFDYNHLENYFLQVINSKLHLQNEPRNLTSVLYNASVDYKFDFDDMEAFESAEVNNLTFADTTSAFTKATT